MILIILVTPAKWAYKPSIIPSTDSEGLWKHFLKFLRSSVQLRKQMGRRNVEERYWGWDTVCTCFIFEVDWPQSLALHTYPVPGDRHILFHHLVYLFYPHFHTYPQFGAFLECSSQQLSGMVTKLLSVEGVAKTVLPPVPFVTGELPEIQEGKKWCICHLPTLSVLLQKLPASLTQSGLVVNGTRWNVRVTRGGGSLGLPAWASLEQREGAWDG